MILIWQRWGILVVAFFGLGVAIGFLLKAMFGEDANSGSQVGVFIGVGFIVSAALLWLVVRATVGKIIDKPRLVTVWRELPEPVVDAAGVKRSHAAVPVLDPVTGQQLITNPRSTLFFIPVRYWPFILGGLGVLIFAANLIVVLSQGS